MGFAFFAGFTVFCMVSMTLIPPVLTATASGSFSFWPSSLFWATPFLLLGRSLPAQIVSLVLALALGGVAYLFTAKRLGLDELRALAQLRRARTA